MIKNKINTKGMNEKQISEELNKITKEEFEKNPNTTCELNPIKEGTIEVRFEE